jgi:hypothetical protein
VSAVVLVSSAGAIFSAGDEQATSSPATPKQNRAREQLLDIAP